MRIKAVTNTADRALNRDRTRSTLRLRWSALITISRASTLMMCFVAAAGSTRLNPPGAPIALIYWA